jgi:hypothetical protein
MRHSGNKKVVAKENLQETIKNLKPWDLDRLISIQRNPADPSQFIIYTDDNVYVAERIAK